MAIEKQKLMILIGQVGQFDRVARRCMRSGVFHPETHTPVGRTVVAMDDVNPYSETLQNIRKVMDFAGIRPEYRDFSDYQETDEALENALSAFEADLFQLHEDIKEREGRLESNNFLAAQLMPLKNLELNLDELFSFRFISLRFGRLPRISYEKILKFGLPENVFFLPTTEEKNTVWGFYFCPRKARTKIDAYFTALFFERQKISEQAHGVPADILANLTADNEKTQKELAELYSKYETVIAADRDHILTAYSRFRFYSDAFALRRYARRDAHLFYLYGWVPARQAEAFTALFTELDDVTVAAEEPDGDKNLHPPTKLRNPWGMRFFEQFVNMYGKPCYNELDPTPLVALSYTLFFGVMFGDVGQGLILMLIGLFAYFKLKMPLGKIMAVIGASSTAFGFLYGSVFGNEEIIKGLNFHVLEGDNTLFTLLAAAGVGIALIVGSMLLNIINGIKQKNIQKIFFDTNGLAGLVLFAGNVTALLLMFLTDIRLYSPLFIILVIVLPVLLIFLREPLGKLCAGERDWKPEQIGQFCMENFFELFEVFLSFLSNVISYVRIGAFAISHAGMMLVVTSMSAMLGGVGGVIVMIFGNILVIGLEGLIVGIQGLRLQFYEFFSRFYAGEGIPYTPITVQFDEK